MGWPWAEGREGLCKAPEYSWQPPWLLRGSHKIKQPTGHNRGQVNEASLYQFSLLSCFPTLVPHFGSLGPQLQKHNLYTNLYLGLHFLGNPTWECPIDQPSRIIYSSRKPPRYSVVPYFACTTPLFWNAPSSCQSSWWALTHPSRYSQGELAASLCVVPSPLELNPIILLIIIWGQLFGAQGIVDAQKMGHKSGSSGFMTAPSSKMFHLIGM